MLAAAAASCAGAGGAWTVTGKQHVERWRPQYCTPIPAPGRARSCARMKAEPCWRLALEGAAGAKSEACVSEAVFRRTPVGGSYKGSTVSVW